MYKSTEEPPQEAFVYLKIDVFCLFKKDSVIEKSILHTIFGLRYYSTNIIERCVDELLKEGLLKVDNDNDLSLTDAGVKVRNLLGK